MSERAEKEREFPLGRGEAEKRYKYLLEHLPKAREAMHKHDGLRCGAGFDNLTRIIKDLGIAIGFEDLSGLRVKPDNLNEVQE